MHPTHDDPLVAVLGASALALSLSDGVATAGGRQTARSASAQRRLIHYIASIEGGTPAFFKQELSAGKTLLQIVQASGNNHYASAEALATALLAPMKTRMDTTVKNGQLTVTQESIIYSALHAQLAKLVTTPHPFLQSQANAAAYYRRCDAQGQVSVEGDGEPHASLVASS